MVIFLIPRNYVWAIVPLNTPSFIEIGQRLLEKVVYTDEQGVTISVVAVISSNQ